MRDVDALPHEKRDGSRFLEQQLRQHAGSVLCRSELLGAQVGNGQVLVAQLAQPAERDYALGGKVDAVDIAYGRNFLINKLERRGNFFAEVSCDYLRFSCRSPS